MCSERLKAGRRAVSAPAAPGCTRPAPHLAVSLTPHLAALAVGAGADGEQHLVVLGPAGHGATAPRAASRPPHRRGLNPPPLPLIGPPRSSSALPIGCAAVNDAVRVTAGATVRTRRVGDIARARAAPPRPAPFAWHRLTLLQRAGRGGPCSVRACEAFGGLWGFRVCVCFRSCFLRRTRCARDTSVCRLNMLSLPHSTWAFTCRNVAPLACPSPRRTVCGSATSAVTDQYVPPI